jgi:pentatricopeptide repeat protein
MLRAWKAGKLVKSDGEPVPTSVKSTEELSNIMADIYEDYLETLNQRPPDKTPIDDLPPRPMANTPRLTNPKPFPPPTFPNVVNYVNDIWSALQVLPTVRSSHKLEPFKPSSLPGKCPYPALRSHGFIQPRAGAYLLTVRPPKQILTFSTSVDFEQYIYSLAFHRDISPRTGKLIMSAFLNPSNTQYITKTAFRYAITALIERSSDIYSARCLAESMTSLGMAIDTNLWNMFLLASLKVESLRSFAATLKEMLYNDLRADTKTWNITLRMGLKLESSNWVYSVLEVMKSRNIPLDHEALQAIFNVLRGVLPAQQLKEYYLKHFGQDLFVAYKPFNVVLHALCQDGKMDEAWELLVQVSEKQHPTESTLHLFIRQCKLKNEYDRVWTIIGEFRRRWQVWPSARGIAAFFDFAYQREEFSDAILVWKYARSQWHRWKMEMKMVYRAHDMEKEYGIRLCSTTRVSMKTIASTWEDVTSGRRSTDEYHLVGRKLVKRHVSIMRARKLSERLEEDQVPEDVRLWREIERTYDAVVAAGLWKRWNPPREIPVPLRRYIKVGRKIRRVRMDRTGLRVNTGLNFKVREKMAVWRLVRSGRLKLDS